MALKNALGAIELEALSLALRVGSNIKSFYCSLGNKTVKDAADGRAKP